MIKTELIKRNPIRILEQSTHGGVERGGLGVITARKGTGKTAFLVHLALDTMLQGGRVLHLSFSDDPHHVETWYRELFREIAQTYRLDQAYDIAEDLLPLRLILHFKQKEISFDEIRRHIDQVEAGIPFRPDVVLIDGCDFEKMTEETLSQWKKFAQDQMASLWFTAILHRDHLGLDAFGIPFPVNRFTNFFSVILMLEPYQDYLDLKLLKDHALVGPSKLRLKLDPKTWLISNHRV